MLSSWASRTARINFLCAKSFSGGSGSQTVTLDKNATWLKFRSSRKLIAFDGFIDTHVQMPAADTGDPFPHLKNNGILSLENLIYNDPYSHDPEHELHVTQPHGYLGGDDPQEIRFSRTGPSLYTLAAGVGVLTLLFYLENVDLNLEVTLDRLIQVQMGIEERLEGKRTLIEGLEQDIQDLQGELSQ